MHCDLFHSLVCLFNDMGDNSFLLHALMVLITLWRLKSMGKICHSYLIHLTDNRIKSLTNIQQSENRFQACRLMCGM